MTFSYSIVHSSKVVIALLDDLGKENRSASTSGILAVFVSSKILPTVNDNIDIIGNPSGISQKIVVSDDSVTGPKDQTDERICKIQISFVEPDSSLSAVSKVLTFQVHLTLEQIASSGLMLPPSDESTSAKSKNDSIALQKLKHLLTLLKETTTNESRNETDATLSSSSKYFMVLQSLALTGNDSAERSTLKISIKERLPNTMVRIVWSSNLLCVDGEKFYDDNKTTANVEKTRNSAAELLGLSLRLTEQHHDITQQLRTVQEQYQLLLRDRDGWKDTALKLDGQWDNEKSILFQNFCTLYTSKQDHDQMIITQLKAEIDALKEQMATNAVSVQRPPTNDTKSKPAELPECLQDVPDDHRAEFDDDVVRRLARGERVPMKSKNNKPKQVSTTTSKRSISESTNALRKRQLNPISGATEYMDADAALEDILEPTTALTSKPVTTKKSRTESSKSDLDLPKSKTKKPITVPIKEEMSSSIAPVKPATKKSDDNSDTASEDDFVDKSMEAQIMADLDALRKM